MLSRTLRLVNNVLPYLIAGFSAPIIFQNASSPQRAGHVAGVLFVASGAWALYLAQKHSYPRVIRFFFFGVLSLEIMFWTWRWFVTTPLMESFLMGLNGGVWHGIMTSLYLSVGLVLLILESAYALKQ